MPSTSAAIFKAFPCATFGNDDAAGETWKFVRADLSVRCPDDSGEPTPEFDRLFAIGAVAVAVWPVGVPLLFLLLVLRTRKAIATHRMTLEDAQRAFELVAATMSATPSPAANECSPPVHLYPSTAETSLRNTTITAALD